MYICISIAFLCVAMQTPIVLDDDDFKEDVDSRTAGRRRERTAGEKGGSGGKRKRARRRIDSGKQVLLGTLGALLLEHLVS